MLHVITVRSTFASSLFVPRGTRRRSTLALLLLAVLSRGLALVFVPDRAPRCSRRPIFLFANITSVDFTINQAHISESQASRSVFFLLGRRHLCAIGLSICHPEPIGCMHGRLRIPCNSVLTKHTQRRVVSPQNCCCHALNELLSHTATHQLIDHAQYSDE